MSLVASFSLALCISVLTPTSVTCLSVVAFKDKDHSKMSPKVDNFYWVHVHFCINFRSVTFQFFCAQKHGDSNWRKTLNKPVQLAWYLTLKQRGLRSNFNTDYYLSLCASCYSLISISSFSNWSVKWGWWVTRVTFFFHVIANSASLNNGASIGTNGDL